MTADARTIQDDIVELNYLILGVLQQDAATDMKGAQLRWGMSARMAQRLARLGPMAFKHLARYPEPLVKVVDTAALHQMLSALEAGVDEKRLQEMHLALLTSSRIRAPDASEPDDA